MNCSWDESLRPVPSCKFFKGLAAGASRSLVPSSVPTFNIVMITVLVHQYHVSVSVKLIGCGDDFAGLESFASLLKTIVKPLTISLAMTETMY